jgi:DNA repair protein RadC
MNKKRPVQEMPREKLLRKGAQYLTDAELLAIFLRTGLPGKGVVQLAEEVLTYFGGVRSMMDAHVADFTAIRGLGQAKFVQLQASTELTRRALNEGLGEDARFNDPQLVHHYLLNNFSASRHERFAGLFLNSKNQLLRFDYLFEGSINSAQVYPRTVAQHCLKVNAAAVIFAHNHPSGDVRPSEADVQLTRRLTEVLALIDVRVLDHFIVGHNQTFSMAAHQMI